MSGRRVHERFSCELPVSIVKDGEEVSCVAANISLGGMYIVTEADLPYGTEVRVRFRVPALKDDATVEAVIRWKQDNGLGVQFGSLRALEVWALNQFFKGLDTAD